MFKPTLQRTHPPHEDCDGPRTPPLSPSNRMPFDSRQIPPIRPNHGRARDIAYLKRQEAQGDPIASPFPCPSAGNYGESVGVHTPSLTFMSETTTRPDSPFYTPGLAGKGDQFTPSSCAGPMRCLADLTPLHRHVLLLHTTIRMDQLRPQYLEVQYCISRYTQAHLRYRKLTRVLEMTPREDSGRIAMLEGQRDRVSELFFTYAEKADQGSGIWREFERLTNTKEVLEALIESAEQERMQRRVEDEREQDEEGWWWFSRFVTHPMMQ